MIQPLLRDDAFLADLATPGKLRLWWLGQSGFLVRHNGRFLLLDPYLSDSLTTKYADTDKPHVRMTERVIAPERLTNISVITSSHRHTDHFDLETLRPLLAANPDAEVVLPVPDRNLAEEQLGKWVWGAFPTDGWPFDGFYVEAVPAAHEELSDEFIGFIVQCGAWTIYHSGDTIYHPAIVERLRRYPRIHVAILPINGAKPERRVAGNLDGREAAQLAHDIGARWVVPCHYEMFEFNTADPRELFIPECERLAQPYRVLRAGEGWNVPAR